MTAKPPPDICPNCGQPAPAGHRRNVVRMQANGIPRGELWCLSCWDALCEEQRKERENERAGLCRCAETC